MKGGRKTALSGDEIRPAFQDLRGQPGGHGARLSRERMARIEPAGGIVAGDNFDRADGLRPGRLRSVKCVLRPGRTRIDLCQVEVAREALFFAVLRELHILLVKIERILRVSLLLRGLDGREIGAGHGGGERLPGKFVIGFERTAFGLRGSLFRANPSPHIGLP